MNIPIDAPQILHTDDLESWREQMGEDFNKFGIRVESFDNNNKAWQAVQSGRTYQAAVIDYETGRDYMYGPELIANLAQYGGCSDILVLSSSKERTTIKSELQNLASEHSLQANEVAKGRLTTAQVFDKNGEPHLMLLYVAAKVLLPKETTELTREKLISALGFQMDTEGRLPRGSRDSFKDRLNQTFVEIAYDRNQASQLRKLRELCVQANPPDIEKRGGPMERR